MFRFAFASALVLGLANARQADPRCGSITQCYLVNLSVSDRSEVFHPVGTPIGSSVTLYDPTDSHAGWSVYCETEGKIEYVKYNYGDHQVNTHYSVPWWANGDNSGEAVNTWEFLEECGLKEIHVVAYTWEGGDEFPCDKVALKIEAECDKPVPAPTNMPVPAPTKMPVPAPTNMPVPAPTKMPVPAPTKMPVPAPTKMPVPAPTKMPVPAPTKMPVPAPTKMPVPAPTKMPVPAPTKMPVPAPTKMPVPAPTKMPVPAPTNAPVQAPTQPPTKITTCTQDCFVFDGSVDYKAIGNSMSYSEDRRNCLKKPSSSAYLSIPSGGHIEKVYLQWSGSGTVDSAVNLNGAYVRATKTYSQHLYGWDFFGAYADVTHLVKGSGTYTVSGLSWSNAYSVCQANAAYGAWSLVAVYSGGDTVSGTRVHVCQDKFRMTFPSGTYQSHIGCIDASYKCATDAEFTIVTYESDAYKGEYFYIGGQYFGDNKFRGSTAPNLDVNTFHLGSHIITGATKSLDYKFQTYYVNSIFGGAVEGLFDFVKVVKYRSKCY